MPRLARAGYVLLLLAAPFGLSAQTFSESPFPAASAVSKDDFRIRPRVRELADGRLLVADDSRQRLVRVDFATGKTDELMRFGPEDNEFRSLGEIWAWKGDSIAILDVIKARLMILAPDGTPARTQSFGGRPGADAPGTAPMTPVVAAAMRNRLPQPRYLTGAQLLFLEGQPPRQPVGQPQGAPIIRYPVAIFRLGLNGRGRDSLTQLLPAGPRRAPLSNSNTGSRTFYVPITSLTPIDAWAAFDDGTVAVLRAKGFRLELTGIDGETVRSDSIPYAHIEVTEKDRKRIMERYRDSTAEVLRTSAERVQTSGVRYQEPTTWPTEHPPFRSDPAPVVGPGNRLWLSVRCVSGEAATCYEVIDRQAQRVARWQLPEETTIVAFGKNAVYTYNRLKSGSERLQRHPLP